MQSIARLPVFGIVYALAGIVGGLRGGRGSGRSTQRALSGVILAIAALNGYVEAWVDLKRFRLDYAVGILIVVFLLPYSALCIRLMERVGVRSPRVAIWSSYLPVVYLLMGGIIVISPKLATLADPPLAFHIFLAFVCVLHVPLFAAGKSQVVRVRERYGVAPAPDGGAAALVLRYPIYALGIPLLLLLILQIAVRADWRLLTSNAVLTAAIGSLFAIARN